MNTENMTHNNQQLTFPVTLGLPLLCSVLCECFLWLVFHSAGSTAGQESASCPVSVIAGSSKSYYPDIVPVVTSSKNIAVHHVTPNHYYYNHTSIHTTHPTPNKFQHCGLWVTVTMPMSHEK